MINLDKFMNFLSSIHLVDFLLNTFFILLNFVLMSGFRVSVRFLRKADFMGHYVSKCICDTNPIQVMGPILAFLTHHVQIMGFVPQKLKC
jgi:hypothetical protein